MTDDNLDDVQKRYTEEGFEIGSKLRIVGVDKAKLFNCIKERINEKPKCKEQCDTCKYFRSEYAKLSNGDFAASQVIPDSVGKSISELSVFEREVRNKTLDDCIEKMEIAIELIRKMKT